MNHTNQDAETLRGSVPASWYCFRDGAIHGPAAIEEIVAAGPYGRDGQDSLISRVGFETWYPLSDLTGLLAAKTRMEQDTRREVERLERLVEAKMRGLESLTDRSAEPKVPPAPSPNEGAFETALMEETFNLLQQAEASPTAPSIPDIHMSASIVSRYFCLRGRARLGRRQSPWLAALVKWPASLGLYWHFWIRSALQEITWHLHNEWLSGKQGLPLTLAAVPGFHFVVARRLATLVAEAEGRHGRPRTSPLLATLLALFPPLAIGYLQSALNRLWLAAAARFEEPMAAASVEQPSLTSLRKTH